MLPTAAVHRHPLDRARRAVVDEHVRRVIGVTGDEVGGGRETVRHRAAPIAQIHVVDHVRVIDDQRLAGVERDMPATPIQIRMLRRLEATVGVHRHVLR
jgi:hypothetical protein